jgi:heptosyltransferase III
MLPRRNVLIFHSGALGDFILTWPLALALGRLFPQSRIFYVTHGQKGALAEKVLRVESIDQEAGWHHLFTEAPALPERPAKVLAGAQYVFSFVAAPQSTWVRNVLAVSPEAQVLTLSQTPSAEYPGHQSDYLLEQLKPLPACEEAVRQILRSVAQRGVTATPAVSAGGPVVLHPGSGSPGKCWPVGRFVELAKRLSGEGRAVRVVLGEVERERWPRADLDALAAVGEVRQPATLLELAEALRGVSGFVGNDSGPGHLAGVLGLPTLCLFGPTDPARWRPLGPAVRTLREEPIAALSAGRVYDTFTALVGRRQETPTGGA